MTQRDAEAFKVKVELLVSAKLSGGGWDNDTARWVARLDETLADKLARVGLIPKPSAATLKPFLDAYIESRVDIKPSTATVLGHTRRCLVGFFGMSKSLRDITPDDADLWRLNLIDQGLADNTVRRRCGIAKQFFAAGIRQRLLAHNSFADLKSSVRGNAALFYFVTKDEA